MLSFQRSDTKVEIKIQPLYYINETYSFYWECNREIFSRLLQEKLSQEMNRRLEKIREEAYLSGYKDGRAKRAKITWFSGSW